MIRDIRNVLTVLLTAVLCAIGLTWGLMRYYESTGRYHARDILLDPFTLSQLPVSRSEGLKRQRHPSFLLRSIVASSSLNAKEHSLTLADYHTVYKWIANEQSSIEAPQDMIASFNQHEKIALALHLDRIPAESTTPIPLDIVIEVVPEDDFRIRFLGDPQGAEWIYFHKPSLYRDLSAFLFQTRSL